MKKQHIAFFVLLLFAFGAQAQFGMSLKNPLKLESGNIDFLKGQETVNVIVMKDKLHVEELSESEFINKTVKEKNAAQAGSGAAWAKKWNEDFAGFDQALKDGFKKSDMTVKSSSKYTILFKINKIIPGWTAGVVGKSASISGTVYIYATANSNKLLAKYSLDNSTGGDTYTTDARIWWCYFMTGRRMGKIIKKL